MLVSASIILSASTAAESELDKNNRNSFPYILNCSACHGLDGNSSNAEWPNIAGLNKNYIKKQLLDFKEGRRKNKYMDVIIRSIPSDAILDQLAAYFSMQQVAPFRLSKKSKLEKLSLGKEIYLGKRIDYGIPGCFSCHGKEGEGGENGKYPRLKGQYREYIVKQMKLFRTNERTNDVPAMMQNIARLMDDEDIESVAAYIDTLTTHLKVP